MVWTVSIFDSWTPPVKPPPPPPPPVKLQKQVHTFHSRHRSAVAKQHAGKHQQLSFTPTRFWKSPWILTGDVVTRVRKIEIPFSCFYSNDGMVSSVGWKPRNRRLVFSEQGQGNYTLSLNMFPDKRFMSPYTNGDFPVAVALRKTLYFEVLVTSDDKLLSIIAERCYATPTHDLKNPLKYEFIKTGYVRQLVTFY